MRLPRLSGKTLGGAQMRNLLLASALVLLFVPPCAGASKTYRFPKCGVTFAVPSTWSATLDDTEANTDRDEHIKCNFALRPQGWEKIAKASRWDANETPLWLTVFTSPTTFEQAVAASGFEKDEERNRFGVPGGYGSFGEAEPFQIGKRTGLVAYSFFRGFIRDESKLEEGESRVFSGDVATVVLKGERGRPFGFECDGGTPDEPVDCRTAMRVVSATLRFTAAPPN